DVSRAQTAGRGSGKIVAVRCHHHAFSRRKAERFAGCEVNARLWLVVSCNFCSEDCVPWKIVASREIDHQGNISVRDGCEQKFAAQTFQRRRNIRPGIESMPGKRELTQCILGEVVQAEARHEALEVATMQDV